MLVSSHSSRELSLSVDRQVEPRECRAMICRNRLVILAVDLTLTHELIMSELDISWFGKMVARLPFNYRLLDVTEGSFDCNTLSTGLNGRQRTRHLNTSHAQIV